MTEGSLSRRYSKALFQLAQEQKQEEAVGCEVEQFLGVYAGSPLQTVLENPAFELDSRRKIVLEVAGKLQLSSLSVRFLSILLERDRLGYLPSIAASYRRLLNAAKGRVQARVVAAAPLDEGVLERVREMLRRISGKEVVLQEESDPTLLGGIMVELEGRIYDGTVRTQLEKMRERIARDY
jgi:F-type H+-transporting ATPase subunit delta